MSWNFSRKLRGIRVYFWLSDEQWAAIEPHLPYDAATGGRETLLPQPQGHPEAPGIPTDPAAAERARKAQAAIEARKARNFKATRDAEGNVIITLDDGTTAKMPARV